MSVLIRGGKIAHNEVGTLGRGHVSGSGRSDELLFVDLNGTIIHSNMTAAHRRQFFRIVVAARYI